MQKYSVIGQSALRRDALDKVLGKARYVADLTVPNMLYAKTLRSEVPHAIVEAIDCAEARALPGVIAVLTAEDVPAANSHGIILKDEPICIGVGGTIRRMGDPLALVAAESEHIAAEALKRIKVRVRELPAVFDMFEAMDPATPKLHDHPNAFNRHIATGDVDAALAASAVVVENEYRTQQVEHGYIETEGALAQFDGTTLTVHAATQNPHYDAKEIARNLGIGMHQVRVIQTVTGGGFGGKLDMSVTVPAALLALKTRRPVRMLWDRAESLCVSVKRHPYIIRMAHGADAEGHIIALRCTVYGDTGAYASYGPGVLTRAAVHCTGPYFIPNVTVDTYTVFTNNPTAGAMRGFGVPQMSFATESQMDILAEKLGLTPYEIRYKNALRPGMSIVTGCVLQQSVGIVKTLEAARAKAAEVMHSTL